jgi:steroid 5-alpha reductase family enzyme
MVFAPGVIPPRRCVVKSRMSYLLPTFLAAFAMMSLCWVVSLVLRDVSIVDILWAPAFATVGWLCAWLASAPTGRSWILLALITLWAFRLGSHILLRWRRLGHEDYRYAAIRAKHGPNFPITSLLWIFWLQALLLWVISFPLQAAIASRAGLNAFDWIGGGVVLIGIAVEGVADAQLTRFRAEPQNRDRVLNIGLWAWSRHPNYFGDFLLWWGIWIMAMAGYAPLWTVLGPIVMSALLLHYSGAGLMEETITDRRPAYRDYIKRTSLFFPWPPRRI